MIYRGRFLLLLVAAILATAGCSSKSTNRGVKLTGKVTYKSQPVTGGSMTLFIAESAYPVAISVDGTYSVTQVPEGEATVTVDTEALNPNKPEYGDKGKGGFSPPPKGASAGPAGAYVKVPEKYRKKETSPLKATLVNGKSEKNFELTD